MGSDRPARAEPGVTARRRAAASPARERGDRRRTRVAPQTRRGRPLAHHSRGDSRAKLLAAAGLEFADHGFGGASVDRIARRARLNKAMIYYHFRSKVGLYREVLRDMYRLVGHRVRALPQEGSPREMLLAFVETVVQTASERPYFPRVLMRELADRARHLDPETVTLAASIPEELAAIITRGVRAGVFRPTHPVLAYFAIIGPIVAYVASAPLRQRATNEALRGAAEIGHDALAHLCGQAVLGLLGCASPADSRPTLEHPR